MSLLIPIAYANLNPMPKTGPNPRSSQNDFYIPSKYGPKPKPLSDRFWGKVRKLEGVDSCWVWYGCTNGKLGYGMLYDCDLGDKALAHRVAWKLQYGKYPNGVLRHVCDNPSCVRVSHLVVGTQLENMLDKTAKGRDKNQGKKLTFAQAEDLRKLYASGGYTQIQLAVQYGISVATTSNILTGKTLVRPEVTQVYVPVVVTRPVRPKLSVLDRFLAKVDKNGELPQQCPELGCCWPWTAAKSYLPRGSSIYQGVGSFRRTLKRSEVAHRVSWELFVGPIPEKMVVRHKCDNSLCVNPKHLELGTQQDNLNDMKLRDRFRTNSPKGEQHANAKLTYSKVEQIRQQLAAKVTLTAIARSFGVSLSTVSDISKGRSWK